MNWGHGQQPLLCLPGAPAVWKPRGCRTPQGSPAPESADPGRCHWGPSQPWVSRLHLCGLQKVRPFLSLGCCADSSPGPCEGSRQGGGGQDTPGPGQGPQQSPGGLDSVSAPLAAGPRPGHTTATYCGVCLPGCLLPCSVHLYHRPIKSDPSHPSPAPLLKGAVLRLAGCGTPQNRGRRSSTQHAGTGALVSSTGLCCGLTAPLSVPWPFSFFDLVSASEKALSHVIGTH